MKQLCVVAAVLVLAGCGDGGGPSAAGRGQLAGDESARATVSEKDDAWTAHMQQKVRQSLKDPDSATFRNARTYHGGGAPVVCGEVNSRNSFGGMSGFQRFVAAGEVIALDEQVDGGITEVWDRFCRD